MSFSVHPPRQIWDQHRTDPEEQALLDAVRADPYDDSPRVIIADWYDEHGLCERGEFIRIQCDRADPRREKSKERDEEMGRRINELMPYQPLVRPHVTGTSPVAVMTVAGSDFHYQVVRRSVSNSMPPARYFQVYYDRGFWNEVHCSLADFIENAPMLFRQPITIVKLTDRSSQVNLHDEERNTWMMDFPPYNDTDSLLHKNLIPSSIYKYLPSIPKDSDVPKGFGFDPTKPATAFYGSNKRRAQNALSYACVLYGRQFAGERLNPGVIPWVDYPPWAGVDPNLLIP